MIEKAINKFVSDINRVTRNSLMTILLHGSFVLNDYRPGVSDLDFFAVWGKRPRPDELESVVNLKKEYREKGDIHTSVLEGEFVFIEDMLNNSYERVVYWGTSGQRITDSCGTLTGFNLLNIKTNGLVVYGEDIKNQLPDATIGDMIKETIHVWKTLKGYYKPEYKVSNLGWILMATRSLSWLETGEIMSKTESAKWAINNIDSAWTKILPEIIKVRKNPKIFINKDSAVKLIDASVNATTEATLALELAILKRNFIKGLL